MKLRPWPHPVQELIFRFERDGRERLMGLGSLDTLALKDARDKALECRRALLDGLDPIELRRERKQKTAVQAARGMR